MNIILLLIVTSITVGATAVILVLRDIINRSAIRKACNNAAPDIAKFKKDNTYIIPLTQEFGALATVLRTTIGRSREMRKETINKIINEIQLPNVDIPLEVNELKDVMVHNEDIFIQTMEGYLRFKVQYLYKDQVKHRLLLMKEVAKKAAKEAAQKAAKSATKNAMTATATDMAVIAVSSDSVTETHDHVMPALNVVDQKVVDLMDKLGLIDPTVELLNKIEGYLHEHLGNTVSHLVHEAAHGGFQLLDGMYEIPGFFIGARTAFSEINMLTEGETSLRDTIINGGGTVAIKACAIKVGMVLDAMTGGLSMGAFTLLASLGGALLSNWAIEQQNIELRNDLKKIDDEIEAHRRKFLRIINKVVCKFEKKFAKRIEACPDINDEISLNEFLKDLKEAYSKGYEQAEYKLSVNTRIAIENVPENTWKHKLLFINTRKAIEKLYLEAQRSITSYHSGLVHNFTLAAETHSEDGVTFLIKDVVFDTPETETVLNKIENVTETCAENYYESLSAWEHETVDSRKKGIKKVNTTIKRESDEHAKFVTKKQPSKDELIKRIKANNIRQGKSAPKTVAV